MTSEISRREAIQLIVGGAYLSDAAGAAATPGRSEPCFACLASRFSFKTPIFLPNVSFRKIRIRDIP
jgi:hypothetical protein